MPHHPVDTTHVFLTGVTGFVGQALLERLLSSTTIPVISVLVRSQPDLSAAQRLERLLQSDAFVPWRTRLGAAADAHIAERVRLVEGSLTDVPALSSDIDLVVHSASDVRFDAPLDEAVTNNVAGPAALYAALHAAGATPHVVHVSTCYTQANRTHHALEDDLGVEICWKEQIASARRHEHKLSTAGWKRSDISRVMTAMGHTLARAHGFTDVYTLTKALGERVALDSWHAHDLPLTIIRPSIIESAYAHPYPGWIDGFKVADPLIAEFAKGRVSTIPGDARSVLDVIPVDFVVSAICAAAHTPPRGRPRFVHVSTSVSNPVTMGQFGFHVQEFLASNPHPLARPNHRYSWQFIRPSAVHRRTHALRQLIDIAEHLLKPYTYGPVRRFTSHLDTVRRALEKAHRVVSIYEPYTSSRTVYDDTQHKALLAAQTRPLPTGEVITIDWEHYIRRVHMPAVMRIMEGRRQARPRRTRKEQLVAA